MILGMFPSAMSQLMCSIADLIKQQVHSATSVTHSAVHSYLSVLKQTFRVHESIELPSSRMEGKY